MSELGPSIGCVYKTEDGLNGYTEEGLIAARRMLNEDIPEAEQMDVALGRVIDSEPGSRIVTELRKEGKVLLGANSGQETGFPEGLMYVEGEWDENYRAFSVIRMGLWVAASRELPGRSWGIREAGRQRIRETLIARGFTNIADLDVKAIEQGVPIVMRTTQVIPLHPQEGDIQEPFVYGHRKDLEAIDKLKVPGELKGRIIDLTRAYHSAELQK